MLHVKLGALSFYLKLPMCNVHNICYNICILPRTMWLERLKGLAIENKRARNVDSSKSIDD